MRKLQRNECKEEIQGVGVLLACLFSLLGFKNAELRWYRRDTEERRDGGLS